MEKKELKLVSKSGKIKIVEPGEKIKEPIKPVQIVTIVVFSAFILFLAIVTLVMDKKTFSELENRNLKSFPKATVKTVLGGEFTDSLEDYTADHFFGRDFFVKLKTDVDLITGKKERNSVYILNDRFVEKVEEPDMDRVNKSIDAINQFALKTDSNVYFMLCPTSAEIYKNLIPEYYPECDQKAFIDGVYSSLDEKIKTVDVYSLMEVNKDKYIYYRTDHHWTSLGAYYGYLAASSVMGFDPFEISNFDIEHASENFNGTLYSSALYDGIEPDTMDYYHLQNGTNIIGEDVYKTLDSEPEFYDSIFFRDFLGVKDKYASFTGSNQPIIKIKSDSDGGKLLVIKDSYAHTAMQFFALNYSEVTMVDMRYIQLGLSDSINLSEFDDILFLYNANTFMTDDNLKNLY